MVVHECIPSVKHPNIHASMYPFILVCLLGKKDYWSQVGLVGIAQVGIWEKKLRYLAGYGWNMLNMMG